MDGYIITQLVDICQPNTKSCIRLTLYNNVTMTTLRKKRLRIPTASRSLTVVYDVWFDCCVLEINDTISSVQTY